MIPGGTLRFRRLAYLGGVNRRRALLLGLALLPLTALLVLWAGEHPKTMRTAGRPLPPHAPGGPTLDGPVRGDPGDRASPPQDDSTLAPAPAEAGAEAAWVVTGRVVTAEGVPLGDAWVRLMGSTPTWREWDSVASAVSRDDGTFGLESEDVVLPGVPWVPSKARLLVEAEGHIYAWRDVPGLTGGARLDLGDVRLRGTGGTISGRVVGPENVPLTAEISVQREDEQERESGEPFQLVGVKECTSEPTTGKFTTAPLPPGRYRLRLRLRLDRGVHYVEEHVPAGTADLVVRLTHVRPGDHPTPFDLRVRVRHESFAGAPPAPAQAPSFMQDRNELSAERLPPGDLWLLRGVVPGERPLLVHPGLAAWGPAILSDPSPEGAVREVLLPRARTLHAVVRLEGQGVPARVQWSLALGPAGALPHAPQGVPSGQQPLNGTVYADGNGRLALSGLPPGTLSLWVNPVHDDQWYATSVPVAQQGTPRAPFHWWGWRDVPLDPEREVVLDVERLLPLVLELTWPDGEPRAAKPPEVLAWRHVENAHGSRLDVEDVAWDGARLVVRIPRPESSKPIDVVLRTPGTWALLGDLAVRSEPYRAALEPCSRIEGRVLGPEGEPQPWASVSARYVGPAEPVGDRYRPAARCDAHGRFVLRPTLPGPYVLQPSVPWEGLAGIPLQATTGAAAVSLRLLPARWLLGRVVGREGEPPPEAWVIVLFPDMEPSDAESERCTDDGFFRIAAPVDREITLRARDADDRVLGEIHVSRNGPSTDLRLPVSAAR